MKILVVGGNGMLGKPVANLLKNKDNDVTILSSRRELENSTTGEGIKIKYGDVTDVESLKRAVEGQEAVHINLSAKIQPELYEKIEIGGCQNISSVAKEAGVKRIGYISGASSRGVKKGIVYLDSKVEAENRIIESGVPYSIFRASWFYETLPSFIQMGKAVVLGEQPMKFGWLAADDYAEQVCRAYSSEEAANKCFYNLGPVKMTMMEALTKYCAVCHPELQPEVVSFATANMLTMMPGMEKLKLAIPFFKYFTDNNEDVDKTETDLILGSNSITVEEWSEKQKQRGNA